MDQQDDPYEPIARLYEAEHQDWTDDAPMYAHFAERAGGPVLDLGCGTGRVALPLAAAGFEVHGLDASHALLAIARAKAHDTSVSLELRCADMRRLAETGRYRMALCALDTFMHLETGEDQMDTLRGVCAALRPGGLFVVDVLHPTLDRVAARDGVQRVQSVFAGPGGASVTHLVSWEVDPATQTIAATHHYDAVGPDGAVQRRTALMRLRYLHRYEMEHALRRAGFDRIELYGGPGLAPFDANSDRMIFVAAKPRFES